MPLDKHLDLHQGGGTKIKLDDVDKGEEALPIRRHGEVIECQLISQLVQLFLLFQQGIIRWGIFQDLNHHFFGRQALCQSLQQQ